MDELGFNKIAAAVLATGLGVMMIRELPHIFMHSEAPDVPAYFVGSLNPEANSAVEDKPLPFPQADWIGAMNAEKGAKVFKKCTSCHNADIGGAHGTGPNLYGIVGAAAAARGDFKYSGALTAAALTWDYEQLDGFLAKPTKYVSGTNMNFIGLKKAQDRAAVIEYLRVAADSPLPQPAPAAAPEATIETAEGAEIAIETMEKMAPETDGH